MSYYPVRSETHVKEQLAIQKFQELLPSKWILRDITERDYGHDAFLQITDFSTGEVLPYIIGI